jgi:hypothetical protein
MLTVREHIDNFWQTGKVPNPLWVHALDVLKHVLKGDSRDTMLKDDDPCESYLKELQSFLDGKPKEVDSFLDAKHNAFVQERKWRRFDSECGDLSVERHLDGELRPFDDYRKKFVDKPAVTLVMDISVPHQDRSGSSIAERHKKIYSFACQANKEGRPCRVIGAEMRQHPEEAIEKLRTLTVLKDYDDPIFPAIWAALENNRLANSYANVTADYFLGTKAAGNGTYRAYDISEDIHDEIILIEPVTWVTKGKGKGGYL